MHSTVKSVFIVHHYTISFRTILESNTNATTSSTNDLLTILVQACEDGLVGFVKALLDHGLSVSNRLTVYLNCFIVFNP